MRGQFIRRGHGQAIMLLVLAMPLFFSVCAVVVDGTNLMVNKRQLQNAADATALAAAQELPTDGSVCAGPDTDATTCLGRMRHQAEVFSDANGGPSSLPACPDSTATNCYDTPYKGSSGLVQIRLEESVAGFFTRVIGMLDAFSVKARAAASSTLQITTSAVTIPGTTNPGTTIPGSTILSTSTQTIPVTTTTPGIAIAIFAYTHGGTDPCSQPGITITGNPATSIDAVVSNGRVYADFSGTLGYAAYGPPALNCPLTSTGSKTVQSSERLTAPQPWPRTFDRAAICAGHDSGAVVTLNNPEPGIYCSTVGIQVNNLRPGNNTLTLVAPYVDIPHNINNFTLTPAPALDGTPNHSLVIWQYGANRDLTFDHNNSGVNGVIWVENGTLTYAGNSGTTGFYEAQHVVISGNSYVMHGSGPPVGGGTTTTSATTTITGTTVGDPITVPGTTVHGTTITTSSTIGTTIGLDE